jgi:DNA-directed RNA polymerase specialized sigma subunit
MRRLRKELETSPLPPANTRETNEAQLAAWRQTGDIKYRDQLISGNLKLAAELACELSSQFDGVRPRPRPDDLFSDGCLAMFPALDALRTAGHSNVYGYLRACIRNAMMLNLGVKSGAYNCEPVFWALTEAPSEATLLEVYEYCHDDLDRQIVRLRSEKTKSKDIAELLGMSETWVSERLSAIHDRMFPEIISPRLAKKRA